MNSIPLTDPIVDYIRAIIPANLHQKAWIAGSAATHWGQNGDVDCWVAGLSSQEWVDFVGALRLNGHDPLDMEVVHEHYDAHGSILLVNERGVHILGARLSMEDVLSGFDLACHAAAVPLTSERELLMADGFDVNSLKVLHVRDPIKTFKRMVKFAQRYDNWAWLEAPNSDMQDFIQETFNLHALSNRDWVQWRHARIDKGF